MTKPRFCYDSDRLRVYAGDWIMFSYGIPPVRVVGEVVEENGKLRVLTPGHSPSSCSINTLRKCVYDFYKWDQPTKQPNQ